MKNFLTSLLLPMLFSTLVAAQPGSLDPSFGNAGIVVTSVNFNAADSSATEVAIQADGKIIATVNARNYEKTAAGDFYVLSCDTGGTLDPSF